MKSLLSIKQLHRKCPSVHLAELHEEDASAAISHPLHRLLEPSMYCRMYNSAIWQELSWTMWTLPAVTFVNSLNVSPASVTCTAPRIMHFARSYALCTGWALCMQRSAFLLAPGDTQSLPGHMQPKPTQAAAQSMRRVL